jgi:hypothetical protein
MKKLMWIPVLVVGFMVGWTLHPKPIRPNVSDDAVPLKVGTNFRLIYPDEGGVAHSTPLKIMRVEKDAGTVSGDSDKGQAWTIVVMDPHNPKEPTWVYAYPITP